jgi:hypothetical protein
MGRERALGHSMRCRRPWKVITGPHQPALIAGRPAGPTARCLSERMAGVRCTTDMVRGRRSRSRRRVIASLLLSIVACSPATQVPDSVDRSPSPTPIQSAAPPSATAAAFQLPSLSPTVTVMEAAPEGCPGPPPRPRVVADFVGPVAFGPPLWAGVYANYDAASNAYAAPDAPYTNEGWRIKILFLLGPEQNAAVELVGVGVNGTDGAVLFAIGGVAPSTAARFDPQDPAIPVQHEGWREYPTYAYFPRHGCFRLTASWPGGSSDLGFGVGG